MLFMWNGVRSITIYRLMNVREMVCPYVGFGDPPRSKTVEGVVCTGA